jgi:hypothetical protein
LTLRELRFLRLYQHVPLAKLCSAGTGTNRFVTQIKNIFARHSSTSNRSIFLRHSLRWTT